MAFSLMKLSEAIILAKVIDAGESPISTDEVAALTKIPIRSVYAVMLGMTGVGLLEQVKMVMPGKGRPKWGYIATGLGTKVLVTHNEVLMSGERKKINASEIYSYS